MAQDDFAIVVGIDHYGLLSPLRGAVRDARSFHAWLVAEEGGALPEENVTLILSDESNEGLDLVAVRPALDDVEEAFVTLLDRAGAGGDRVGRRLYIFLAGHGFGPELDEAALLLANADSENRIGRHVPGRLIAQSLQARAIFDEVVLFMDCCRDVLRSAPVTRRPIWDLELEEEGAGVGYFYGLGTKWGSVAREQPLPPDDEPGGIFTWALLEALRQARGDEEGRVTASMIEGYVHERLQKAATDAQSPIGRFAVAGTQSNPYIAQKPEFDYRTPDDFVVLRRETTPTSPVEITVGATADDGPLRLFDSGFREVAQWDAGAGTWSLELPAGRYAIIGPPALPPHPFDVVGQEVIRVAYP